MKTALITGFTARMVNSDKIRYDYATSVAVLKKVLVDLGYDVVHQPIKYGEPLDQYDVIFYGISLPMSFASKYLKETCHVFSSGKKVILYCDDWSIEKFGEQINQCVDEFEKFIKFFKLSNPKITLEQEASISHMFVKLKDHQEDYTLLTPAFKWGDITKLSNPKFKFKLAPYDPSPYIFDAKELPVNPSKQRKWILGALQKDNTNFVKKCKFKWPVEWYGNKRQGVFISEKELEKKYDESYGVICLPYQIKGSGWWRVRYYHAAQHKNILINHKKDAEVMDKSFTHNVSYIESMTNEELKELANKQSEYVFKNIATKEEVKERVKQAIERVYGTTTT